MTALAVATLVTLQSLFAVSDGAEFKCRKSLIADEWRAQVLKVHNDNRRRLAKGNQAGQGGTILPVAQNMNELIWDCSIEDTAYAKAAACTSPPTVAAGYGAVSSMITAKASSCNATTAVAQALNNIWKTGAAKQTDQAQVPGNDDFSQMAYFETNGVGCSYKWCSGKLYLVCIYNKDGTAQANLYSNGAAGQTCNMCAPNQNSDNCVDGLCQVALPEVIPTSTICPNAHFGKWITDDLRSIALDMHNYYRRLLATGWAKDKQLGYAKPATAMPELAYNCKFEEEIMTDLPNCAGKVVSMRTAGAISYKQYTPYDATREDAFQEVLKEWWSPLANTGIPDNKYLDSMFGTDLQNYVNMAYANTTEVGCGIQVCKREGWIEVQCGYETGTFDEGNDIYYVGKTCSTCGKLTPPMKCSPLGGLCIP